jgi:hypothetical protein
VLQVQVDGGKLTFVLSNANGQRWHRNENKSTLFVEVAVAAAGLKGLIGCCIIPSCLL